MLTPIIPDPSAFGISGAVHKDHWWRFLFHVRSLHKILSHNHSLIVAPITQPDSPFMSSDPHDTMTTSSFLVGTDDHQHRFMVTEVPIGDGGKVLATCTVRPATASGTEDPSLKILVRGNANSIAPSLQTLIGNTQGISGPTKCFTCLLVGDGKQPTKQWDFHSVFDDVVPAPGCTTLLEKQCSAHGPESITHLLRLDLGTLLVNDHNTRPVTRLSYMNASGDPRSALLLTNWDDVALFSQAYPTSGCLIEALEAMPIAHRSLDMTSGCTTFAAGPDGVSAALLKYAGAQEGSEWLLGCPTGDLCFPTGCYTSVSTLARDSSDGNWEKVMIPGGERVYVRGMHSS